MKYLAVLLVAAAAAGAYFYFGSPDFGASSPEDAALAAKSEKLFPDDRAARKKWIAAAKGVSAQIAALAPSEPSADFEKIKSRADGKFDPASPEKFEYVRAQLAALAKIESGASDDDVLDSEFALAKKLAAEKSPDDFVAQSKLAASYCSMFAEARRARADSPKQKTDGAYAEFVAAFPSNPSGALARFKKICAAHAAFENAHGSAVSRRNKGAFVGGRFRPRRAGFRAFGGFGESAQALGFAPVRVGASRLARPVPRGRIAPRRA